jgi:DNA replication protein DnaC
MNDLQTVEGNIKKVGDIFPGLLERLKETMETPEHEALLREQEARDAERRQEEEKRRRKNLLERRRIPLRYQGLSLDNYPVSTGKQAKVVCFLKNYGKKAPKERENLIIHGAPGTGKTHMICAFIQDSEWAAEYWKLSDIMRNVKNCFSPKVEETELKFLERLARVPVLAIDEIGRTGGTVFEGSFMFDLLDDRYDNLLPTILISNLPAVGEPSMTSYLGIAVMDRINENSLDIVCEWANYREHAEAQIVTRTRLLEPYEGEKNGF